MLDSERRLGRNPTMQSKNEPTPSPGPPSGARIIDLSAVVSGPMAAVVLADQGAEVIKVEPPGWGDGVRYLGASRGGVSAIFSLINRNKKSLALNLKHPDGQAILMRLLATADGVMHNYRPGKMERLGLGYASLREHFPDLIYLAISGMGDVGPYAGQKVYDYVIQGLSGILDVQGTHNRFEMVRTIIYDKVTALTAAQAMTAGLFNKAMGRGGTEIKVSMLDSSIYFNWPDLMWNESFIGDGVQYSGDLADQYEVSETADGAIVSHRLNGSVKDYDTETLLNLFVEHEIPAARVNARADIRDDPQIIAQKTLKQVEHPLAGPMLQPRPPARFGSDESFPETASPALGDHTDEVLTELGYDQGTIGSLRTSGAIG